MSSLSKAPALRPPLPRGQLENAARAVLVVVLLVSVVAYAEEPTALSLSDALRIAGDQSPQLAAQRSAIAAAEQGTVSARQLPDPKLFFGVDNLPVTGADSLSLTRDFMTMRKIGVMQDFPRGEKRELKGQLAERVTAREQAMLSDVQASVRRDVASAWIEGYFAQAMGAILDEQIGEAQLQSDALKAGLKSGKAQTADFIAVQLSIERLHDKRAEFDKLAARAKAMLSRWLGSAADRPLAPFAPAELSAQQGVLNEHIVHHPHVQSLDRQVDVAQTEAYIARAASKPDWSLQLAYQQRGPTYSNMVSVQVAIDLPLFQKNRQHRDTAAKLALVQQARDLKEDAVRLHLAEAQAAWSDWETSTARLKRFDTSLLPLAHERTQSALAAYKGGRGDLSTVLAARRDEIELKLQKLQLAGEQGRAYAQLLYFLPNEAAQ